MKLKGTLIGLGIGVIALSQTSCSIATNEYNISENNNPATDVAFKQEQLITSLQEYEDNIGEDNIVEDILIDDTKIMDEFRSLFKREEVDISLVYNFIHDNAQQVSQENASAMILDLEELMISYRLLLEEEYLSEAIQIKLLEAYTKGGFVIDPNMLDDEQLIKLVQKTIDNGFKLEEAEGFHYPVIDYSIFSDLSTYASEEIKAYFDIMEMETDEIFAKDAALLITWDQVINRALKLEEYLVGYKSSIREERIQELYNRYLWIVMFGLDNTPIFDENGVMYEEVRNIYEEFTKREFESEFIKTLRGFLEVLSKNQNRLTKDVEDYRQSKIQR